MSPRPLKPTFGSFDAYLELAQRGQLSEALEQLRRAMAAQPLHAQLRGAAVEALTRIARIAEAAGDVERAGAALEEAVRVAPQFADAHYRLGLTRLAARRPEEARACFAEALRINPRYVAARVEMALLDARQGLLGEALETLRRLDLERSPHEPRLFRQGIQSLEHADWEEAGALLRQALRLDQPGVNETLEDVRTRMERGDRPGAMRLLRDSLRTYPGYTDLYFLLGVSELDEGHVDDAIATLGRALEIHPDYHAARVQLARALEAGGDLVQAEEQVGLVLEADPQNPQALELAERWGRLHRRRGRAARSVRKAS